MSPHHFHRIYHAMQGETAADTVRRLRLHRAAVELITGELPVTRIARRAGYGSQEAFTQGLQDRLRRSARALPRLVRSPTHAHTNGGRDGHDDDASGHDSRDAAQFEWRRSHIAATT